MLFDLKFPARKPVATRFRSSCKLGAAILLFLNCTLSVANSAGDYAGTTLANKFSPINVDITTHLGNKQTFLEGDTISFFLSLDTDAHLLVIYEDAAGHLTQLVPNSLLGKSLYKAGLFITLPDKDAAFHFKVRAPFGEETLWAFASDAPLPELEGEYLKNGLKQIKPDMAAIKRQLLKHKQTAFGETKLVIHTKGTKDRN